jgi:hypothetical protein
LFFIKESLMAIPVSRRAGLGLTAAALIATTATPSRAARRKLDFSKPEDNLYAVVKLRGDVAGRRVLQWYTGTLSLVVPGKLPAPVCRYQGIIRTDWVPQADGSFTYRTFDLGFFGDLETGRHAETLTNPITNDIIEPMQVRDGPVNSIYSVHGAFANSAPVDTTKSLKLPWVVSGNDIWYQASFGFEFPNPLPPAQYPELSSTDNVVQRSQFTYKGRLSELEDDNRTSAPMETIMVVTSTIHPWLKMGRMPGMQQIHTFSHKIASVDEASVEMRNFLAKVMPDYLTKDVPFESAGNSFAAYKRQRIENKP